MFNRILLAIDDSSSGPAAISFAVAQAGPHASVHVVHVNEFVVGGRGHTVETRNEAAQVLSEAVAELESAGVAATGEVAIASCFNVARRITDIAQEYSADVIVVGSRRRSRLGGLRGRSMRERITALTSLPLMTAPPPLRVGRRGFMAPKEFVLPRLTGGPSFTRTGPSGSAPA